jgi:hypothetical protein
VSHMFRRRTDKIYATLQQVQRRMSQGTEPGDTAYSGGPSSVPPTAVPSSSSSPVTPASAEPRSWSADHGGTSSGYLVTPDGRRIDDDPDAISQNLTRETQAPRDTGYTAGGMIRPAPRDRGISLPAGSAGGGATLPSAAASQAAAPATTPPPQATAQRSGMTMGGDEEPEAPPPPPVNPALGLAASEGKPRRIELSIELASVLMVAWLITLAVAFFVGQGQFIGTSPARGEGGSNVALAGDRVLAGGSETVDRGQPPPGSGPVVRAEGDHVLVLRSVARYSSEQEQRFMESVRKFNSAGRGTFDPLFGVRRTSSGGLQFIYGQVGSAYGIQKDDDRARQIENALKGKFPDAFWAKVN